MVIVVAWCVFLNLALTAKLALGPITPRKPLPTAKKSLGTSSYDQTLSHVRSALAATLVELKSWHSIGYGSRVYTASFGYIEAVILPKIGS